MNTLYNKYIFVFLLIISCISYVSCACHNNCNKNGICNNWNTCECFSTWSGYDCSVRVCPSGNKFSDIPSSNNIAHSSEICSGQGICTNDGLCQCHSGYTGHNCERILCENNCNHHGSCMSLSDISKVNDGFHYNRTTTYNLWDSNVIYGCYCDSGWSGYDCSQRVCESGTDPRLGAENGNMETVTLVCTCPAGGCIGNFKLRMYGKPTNKWIVSNTATPSTIQTALMGAGMKYTDNAAHTTTPILVSSTGNNGKTCESASTVYTTISFRRHAGDVPAISIYADLLTTGSIHFETTQIMSCDCTASHTCYGSFSISFDGVSMCVGVCVVCGVYMCSYYVVCV